MHTTVVIVAGDAPEWISVLHADGSLSEVKVTVENDMMHIFIEPAKDKYYTVNGPGQWINEEDWYGPKWLRGSQQGHARDHADVEDDADRAGGDP